MEEECLYKEDSTSVMVFGAPLKELGMTSFWDGYVFIIWQKNHQELYSWEIFKVKKGDRVESYRSSDFLFSTWREAKKYGIKIFHSIDKKSN